MRLLPWLLVLASATGAVAQDSAAPLSAIDWLSESVRPQTGAPGQQGLGDVGPGTLPGEVSVSPIDGPLPDATGLLPARVTGLPADLWSASSAADIAARIATLPQDPLPALQDLIISLLLAELAPPADTGPDGVLLTARVDALLARGAVEQAQGLVDRSGIYGQAIFRRAFDISLLLGNEDKTCATLRDTPALSPTFPARIYCLARGGDWTGAALSLETGRALGFVTADEDQLLARFLELGLADDSTPLQVPLHPTPLEFRMYEAIGRPLPTANLPLAFAHTDLHAFNGWKTQIEAAERLTRAGAIDVNQLIGLYTERSPAASGGVWDRAAAIQALDAAFLTIDPAIFATALEEAWDQMVLTGLEVPFARHYCPRLAGKALPAQAEALKARICLLAGIDVAGAGALPDELDHAALLNAISARVTLSATLSDPAESAIAEGLTADGPPPRLASMLAEKRTGEALLRAITMVENGATGDLDELADGLRYLRYLGLDSIARRAAVEILLLDRRG